MEDLKHLCVELTQEIVDGLESKTFTNGKIKKVGDLVLYVMLHDHSDYHLLPINYDDLNNEYDFTGKFYSESESNPYFPVVVRKFLQPEVASLKDFNDYVRNFPEPNK
jgi:hypothetical protein